MRTLIVGTRTAPPAVLARVRAVVAMLPDDALVISGDGGDVDKTAIATAKERGLQWEEVPALWDRHGRRAGPRRNAEMVQGWWTLYQIAHPRFVAEVQVRHTENLVVRAPPILTSNRTAYSRYLWRWIELRDLLERQGATITEAGRCPRPALAFAFWDGKSPGTKDTLALCEKRGVPVKVEWA